MPTALTRAVSRSLASCELTWVARREIDLDLASEQHAQYELALAAMGVRVIPLPRNYPNCPMPFLWKIPSWWSTKQQS